MTPGERALRDSAAVVRLDRVVFRLRGEKPLAYLHDVLAQDVAALGEGRGALAVALDPNGRVSAELRVLPMSDDVVLIDAEVAAGPGIEERIGRHAPLAGCGLTVATGEFPIVAVRGPGADDVLRDAGIPSAGEAAFGSVGDIVIARVEWGVPGLDVLGPLAAVDALLSGLGVPEATGDAFDALRIAAGRPRYGVDVDASMLVNETPYLTHALALDKGCYPGQESVARVHNLGSVRRILRGLRSRGSIPGGAAATHEGAEVGRVRSAADLPEGGSAAIAYVKSEVAPGSVVDADGVDAEVVALS